MNVKHAFDVGARCQPKRLPPSLCAEGLQSCEDTSIIAEADAPISVLTAARADLTVMQLGDWKPSLSRHYCHSGCLFSLYA